MRRFSIFCLAALLAGTASAREELRSDAVINHQELPAATLSSQEEAFSLAYSIVPLAAPGLDAWDIGILQQIRNKLQPDSSKLAAQGAKARCYVDAGLVTFIYSDLQRQFDVSHLRSAVATVWANRYSPAQLQKILDYVSSPAIQKMDTAIRTRPMPYFTGLRQFDLMRRENIIDNVDYNYIRAKSQDPDIANFANSITNDLKRVTNQTAAQMHEQTPVSTKKFMQQNPVVVHRCNQLVGD